MTDDRPTPNIPYSTSPPPTPEQLLHEAIDDFLHETADALIAATIDEKPWEEYKKRERARLIAVLDAWAIARGIYMCTPAFICYPNCARETTYEHPVTGKRSCSRCGKEQ